MKKVLYGIYDGQDLVMLPDDKGYLKSMTEDIARLRKITSDDSIVTITLESYVPSPDLSQNPASPA